MAKDPAECPVAGSEAVVETWAGYGGTGSLRVDQPLGRAIAHVEAAPEGGVGGDDDLGFLRVVGLGGGKGKGEIDNPLQKNAAQLIGCAKHIAQFMDRDTRPDFAFMARLP